MADPYDTCVRCGSWHYTHGTGDLSRGCPGFLAARQGQERRHGQERDAVEEVLDGERRQGQERRVAEPEPPPEGTEPEPPEPSPAPVYLMSTEELRLEAYHLLHKLWGEAKDRTYNKPVWSRFAQVLNRLGIPGER